MSCSSCCRKKEEIPVIQPEENSDLTSKVTESAGCSRFAKFAVAASFGTTTAALATLAYIDYHSPRSVLKQNELFMRSVCLVGDLVKDIDTAAIINSFKNLSFDKLMISLSFYSREISYATSLISISYLWPKFTYYTGIDTLLRRGMQPPCCGCNAEKLDESFLRPYKLFSRGVSITAATAGLLSCAYVGYKNFAFLEKEGVQLLQRIPNVNVTVDQLNSKLAGYNKEVIASLTGLLGSFAAYNIAPRIVYCILKTVDSVLKCTKTLFLDYPAIGFKALGDGIVWVIKSLYACCCSLARKFIDAVKFVCSKVAAFFPATFQFLKDCVTSLGKVGYDSFATIVSGLKTLSQHLIESRFALAVFVIIAMLAKPEYVVQLNAWLTNSSDSLAHFLKELTLNATGNATASAKV